MCSIIVMGMDYDQLLPVLYKIITLGLGLLVISMGVRLYLKGIDAANGDISASWGDFKIAIRNTAPGIILALVGGAVMIISAYRGIEMKSGHKGNKNVASPNLVLTDTTMSQLNSNRVNTDSLYREAKKDIKAKHYLEAYKKLLIVKGITLSDTSNKLAGLDNKIGLVTRLLTKAIYQSMDYNSDETRSVKMNDEEVDSSK